MSRLFIAVACAVLAGVPVLAQDQQAPAEAAADPETARIVADCSARKFESAVEIDKDGQKRLTTFKLCAAKDADDAAWARTLRDAKAKIAAHPDISAESKSSIAAQLDVELAKLGPAALAEAAPPAPAPAVATATPPAAIPPPAAVASTTTVVAKPEVTLRCLAPGESGMGSRCTAFERATRLQIRADTDLGQSTRLRFLRRGDPRGEIALVGLKQGEWHRSKLPPELCEGVASSKVEVQVLAASKVVETLGPYSLRC